MVVSLSCARSVLGSIIAGIASAGHLLLSDAARRLGPARKVSRIALCLIGLTLITTATRGATISGFAPDRGLPGTEVTIAGTGLQSASVVYFGSTEAPGEIISRSATSVRARVPPNALSGQISVFLSTGGAATSFQIFIAAPRITEFNPITGGPGTQVRVEGANFATGQPGGRGNVTQVAFNGQPARFELTGINLLFAYVPTNASSGPITVVNEAGSYTTFVPFEVPALLTGFAPTNGIPGDTIEVRGRNLGSVLRVEFGQALAAFALLSPTNLTAVVPTNAINSRIQITTPAGLAGTTSNFVVKPRIITFSPAFGKIGTNVALEGGGFHGATEVQFNGVKATTVSLLSSTRIQAVVPNGATTGPIKIVTTNGTFTTTESFNLPAVFTSFNPNTGARGDTITIDGQNLGGVTRVQFNGVESTFTVVSPTRITTVVPALATSGRLSVESPAGAITNTANFTVEPLLDGYAPTTGPVGTVVNLAGAGLTNLTWVRLGDADATFTVVNSTNVRVVVPIGAYSGPFHVRTTGGLESSAPGNFFVEGAVPVLQSFNPTSGSAGTPVVLTGLGLRTTSRVQFNGADAVFTIQSATQVDATVPGDATTGTIAVTTLDGIAQSASAFVVATSGPVSLSIQVGQGLVTLRWSVSAVGYVLEASPQLGPAATWQVVPTSPVDEGDTRRVTLPLTTTGSRYFRLRK